MRLTLFLPHFAVTGGLGVHARSLLKALLLTAQHDDALTVLYPSDPQRLFPNSGLEPNWNQSISHPQTQMVAVDWPVDRPLSAPLDEALRSIVPATRPDLFYASYYTGLAEPPCPQVITFHDAGFLDFPEVFGETARQRRDTITRIRSRIDRLHCISNDARDRICRLLPFDPQRTAVVGHALADSPEEISLALKSSRLDPLWPNGDRITDWGDYFFSPVGAATGFNRVRKNLPIAVEAFRELIRDDHASIRFVIASTGRLHEKMLRELLPASESMDGQIVNGAWRSADDRVRVLPNLDRMPFLQAMSKARAVVYPSRYEGFGFPVIEAMALGVPLLASHATSIPEVAGDAGYLVNPDRRSEFVAAMNELLTNPDRASDLVQKGRARAGLFTLERMGQSMWSLFRSVLGTPPAGSSSI